MDNPNSHKRASWRREVILDRTAVNSPLMKLAAYARDKADAATRTALCTGAFSSTLDELLKADSTLDDLSGEERAFCEGWALLARRQCYDPATDAIDDAKLKQWIDEQMKQPPWIEAMTG